MKVMGVVCSECKDTIYSRAVHDYHCCTCGKTSIDGGFEYLKYGWDPEITRPETVEIEIEKTREQLYSDWNYNFNKFGTITAPKPKSSKKTRKLPSDEVGNPP